MAKLFDSFQRGFAQARADTARPAAPDQSRLRGEATQANGAAAAAAEQKAVADVTALAEQLTAEVALLAEVLRLSGVKTYLVGRFHPDKHPSANEAERETLTARLQQVNAAYEIAERTGSQ